jgi:serine/threonine-protein kinase
VQIDVGAAIAGKYELVRLLGRGSMGEVWVAHHRTLGEYVAVKVLSQASLGGEGGDGREDDAETPQAASARFLFEAQVAARLSRKTRHIVRVTDHGEENGTAYLVMELLEGETLEEVLVREARVPLPRVVEIVMQVARALTHAHAEGVLHRDIKPANIFLARDEDGRLLAKLLDFGIARALHAHRLSPAFSTARGLVFGTPTYMSPEQARASGKLDHRCDLWSLATVAYEAICGELPVDGADTDEVLKNVCAGRMVPLSRRITGMPPGLDAFFRRAFADAISSRYQSAGDLANAFQQAAGVVPRVAAGELTSAPLAAPTLLEPAPPVSEAPVSKAPPSALLGDDVDAEAHRLRRRTRTRAVLGAAMGLAVILGAIATWRVLGAGADGSGDLGSASHAASGLTVGSPSNASPGAGLTPTTSTAAVLAPPAVPTLPAVPVSALPAAGAAPPGPGGIARRPGGPSAAVPGTVLPVAPGYPGAGAPPSATAAAPATVPAPTHAPTAAPAPTKVDKSEVF